MESIEKLKGIVEHLRSSEGCPWDREQTHESLVPYLIEETSELVEAILNQDDENFCEELGDMLMHLVMQGVIAEEREGFCLSDAAEAVSDKLVKRHPHVWGDMKAGSAEEILANWDNLKALSDKEKGREPSSVLKKYPRSLSALLEAENIHNRLRKNEMNIRPKAETNEAKIGEQLYRIVAEAEAMGFCAEMCLRKYLERVKQDVTVAEQTA